MDGGFPGSANSSFHRPVSPEDAGYKAGYDAGYRAGLAARTPADGGSPGASGSMFKRKGGADPLNYRDAAVNDGDFGAGMRISGMGIGSLTHSAPNLHHGLGAPPEIRVTGTAPPRPRLAADASWVAHPRNEGPTGTLSGPSQGAATDGPGEAADLGATASTLRPTSNAAGPFRDSLRGDDPSRAMSQSATLLPHAHLSRSQRTLNGTLFDLSSLGHAGPTGSPVPHTRPRTHAGLVHVPSAPGELPSLIVESALHSSAPLGSRGGDEAAGRGTLARSIVTLPPTSGGLASLHAPGGSRTGSPGPSWSPRLMWRQKRSMENQVPFPRATSQGSLGPGALLTGSSLGGKTVGSSASQTVIGGRPPGGIGAETPAEA